MRKAISAICTLLGVILIFAAGVLVGVNTRDERCAEEQAAKYTAATAERVQELAAMNEEYDVTPDYELDPGRDMPVESVSGQDLIGQVEIPRLGRTLPVGTAWSAAMGSRMPCRLSGSAYSDDLIIAGHSYNAHFKCLYDIEPGDEVVVTDMDGNRFGYLVSGIETIPGDRRDLLESGDWDLTLFTCTPNSTSRVTVRCERVRNAEV